MVQETVYRMRVAHRAIKLIDRVPDRKSKVKDFAKRVTELKWNWENTPCHGDQMRDGVRRQLNIVQDRNTNVGHPGARR